MSEQLEKAKALREAFQADEAFAVEFKQAVEARDVEQTIALAAKKGIELTVDDFAPNALEGKELDEAELAAVAGGYSWEEFMSDVSCVTYLLMATAM